MAVTRQICGVEIELHRDATGTAVRIGDEWLDSAEVAALEVCRADWSMVVRIGEFDFTETDLRELQNWVAAATEARDR